MDRPAALVYLMLPRARDDEGARGRERQGQAQSHGHQEEGAEPPLLALVG